MQTSRFQKRVENFTCEKCAAYVEGSGYTNHCPVCLWSKHVDINPGDRAQSCGGAMKPVALEGSSPRYVLLHRCERCGVERRNTLAGNDDMQAALCIAGIQ